MKRKIFLFALLAFVFIAAYLWFDYKDTYQTVKEVTKISTPVEKKVETPIPIEKKIYKEVAKKGDGVTHLARRAIAKYLKEKNLTTITNEQKVFAEDFLVKKLENKYGKVRMAPESVIEFDGASIDDAVSLSLKVDGKNLTKYSKKVNWKKYQGV